MTHQKNKFILAAAALASASLAMAGDDPRHERHELMESVGDAAKPVGQMFKGEREYDAGIVMTSLETWHEVSMKIGELFPPGSETGEGTEAAPAIWEDREGFESALADWREATKTAIDAAPQTLEDAKPVVGQVFNTCKGCHDTYRIDEEEE